MLFWAQMGVEEMSASGYSYLNRGEAYAVEKIVTHLLQNGIAPEEIGVVTPYEGQRAYVVNYLTRTGVYTRAYTKKWKSLRSTRSKDAKNSTSS